MSTVAIYGATGNVGRSTTKPLIKLHNEKKIKLVVLHRPTSDIASLNLPSDVETRSIDLAADNEASTYVPLLQDVDVLLPTAMAYGAQAELTKLMEALSANGRDAIFFDPMFGAHARGDLYPELAGFSQIQQGFVNKGKSLGLKMVRLPCGFFDTWVFGMGFTGVDVNANTVEANEKQLKNKFPLVSTDYLGAVIAELSARPKEEIAGKTFSAVEKWVTGEEFVKALETVNGTAPTVKDWTKADFERTVQEPPMGFVKATYLQQWTDNTFEYPNEVQIEDFKRSDLVELAKSVKKA